MFPYYSYPQDSFLPEESFSFFHRFFSLLHFGIGLLYKLPISFPNLSLTHSPTIKVTLANFIHLKLATPILPTITAAINYVQ